MGPDVALPHRGRPVTPAIPPDAKRVRLSYDISCKECNGTGSAFTDSDGNKWQHRLCEGKGEITVVTDIEVEQDSPTKALFEDPDSLKPLWWKPVNQ